MIRTLAEGSPTIKTLAEDSLGLIPIVVQDVATNKVLMVGFGNEATISRTKATGLATFWSRSRNEVWVKGETSGNYLRVQRIVVDCDNDTVIYFAKPDGPTCHTGTESCFTNVVWDNCSENEKGAADGD